MIAAAVSKACWAGLVVLKLAHAGWVGANPAAAFANVWGAEPNGYAGGAEGVAFLSFLARAGAVHEISLALGALLLGDTKLCFTIFMLVNMAAASCHARDCAALVASASKDLTDMHVAALEKSVIVMAASVALCAVGFAASSRKNNPKVQRSTSTVASLIIKATCLLEIGINAASAMDSERFYTFMVPGFSTSILTPVGKGVMPVVGVHGALACVATMFLIMSLKPTRAACALGMLLHAGMFGGEFVAKTEFEAVAKPSATGKALTEMCNTGLVFHGALFFLLLVAFVIGKSPAEAKSKTS